jgi:hypothetical protein
MKWDKLTFQQKDRLVAEKIFNHAVVEWEGTSALLVVNEKYPSGFAELPAYTTDMNAAWQIVEKLYEQLNVRIYVDNGLLCKYEVKVFVRDDIKTAGCGYSDTSMSEAICMAALRVYGVEIG